METDKLEALLKAATPGPWEMHTVRTSCGVCHQIGPFPRPNYDASFSRPGWACVYDDYPPTGAGKPDLVANAALIAAAPDLAAEVLRLRAENAQLIAANQALVTREAEAREVVDNLLDAITAEDRFGDRALTIQGGTGALKWLLESEEDARAFLAGKAGA